MNQQLRSLYLSANKPWLLCLLTNVLIHFSPAILGMVFHLWKEHLLTASYNWGLGKDSTASMTATCLSRTICPKNMGRLGDFLWRKKSMQCSAKRLNCYHESGWFLKFHSVLRANKSWLWPEPSDPFHTGQSQLQRHPSCNTSRNPIWDPRI